MQFPIFSLLLAVPAAASPYFHLRASPNSPPPLANQVLKLSPFTNLSPSSHLSFTAHPSYTPFIGFFETPLANTSSPPRGTVYHKGSGRFIKLFLQTEFLPELPRWRVQIGEGWNHTASELIRTLWKGFAVMKGTEGREVLTWSVEKAEGETGIMGEKLGGWYACREPGVERIGLFFGEGEGSGANCYEEVELMVEYFEDREEEKRVKGKLEAEELEK